MGFTAPNELPMVISGALYEVVSNLGSVVHYIATDQTSCMIRGLKLVQIVKTFAEEASDS